MEETARGALMERVMRTLRSCVYTVNVVNERLPEPSTLEDRTDLLLLAEDLAAASMELVARAREIAWRDGGPVRETMPESLRDFDDF
jgi:hypothetical protein